ncbi:MAG: STAS domain-containing protein [Anaerolineae bacterium]
MSMGQQPCEPSAVFPLVGRVDALTSPAISARLDALQKVHRGTICVDMAQTTYISTSGLRALLLAHQRQQTTGGRLLLCSVPAKIARVLHMCGLDRILQSPEGSGSDEDISAPGQ